jgi:hypothetical protein
LGVEHYDSIESVGRTMTISMRLAVSILAVALGVFAAASPGRAANIFASGRLKVLPPRIILCLGGVLLAFDSLGFW